ncbi:hypothetical protein DTO006G1_2591 [Penicillium roqueforti]|uniref:uncharacterized protein n=1 Tax=Penicillium roqueforti TaxID=5082 RepID=UPI001909E18E|nr:uncharacterized protein LCP9604111_1800 [Penicillium roqueforti]KAF9251804.1 hypothetical protein LCP9604111_1800 [Penicillium roqueforti]KAI1836382.1 hypothetical protein CBS147337_2609 [Penicillium roqueforti]KAI2685480.1 hypothetical protein LCP963914a_4807 [Penicillium roqueforti]KAI2690150.1 hypothetical protein CBS147355_601 [Penicillium roqueforti]KAI2702658.1 hypothetical protein CBS147372_4391 [Penicillium roqueforti]
MEQSAQTPIQGLSHGNSLPADYWSTLDPAYPDPEQQLQQPSQPQHQPQQQHDSASQPTPLGIGWDHPVFQQQPRELASRPDPNHGIYSSVHQPWQQANPLQQPPQRGYGASHQYQIHSQAPHFQQDGLSFDSRPLSASESSSFPSFPYQQNYFHPQNTHISVPDTFPEAPAQQRIQPRQQQQPQSSISAYSLPQSYSSEMLQNTIDLTNDYSDSDPNVTINPQFLNSIPQAFNPQQSSLTNNFIQGIPADLKQQGSEQGRQFNYYQHDLSVQSHMALNGNPVIPPGGLPVLQVVVPDKKGASNKQQTKKTSQNGRMRTLSKSESESSDESDLEIEAPDEPSPIPPIRPTEPEAAAQYDTLQAVWSPRNKWPGPEKVKNALVAYKELVKGLRDAWKEQVQAMKLAENQDDNQKATQLKEKVTSQRRTMDKIATTTLEMGHPNIVEKYVSLSSPNPYIFPPFHLAICPSEAICESLWGESLLSRNWLKLAALLGEHPMVVAALYSFLLDRFQAADFAGTLTINLLSLFSRFSTLTEDLMQKTNLSKLLPKFLKKGGQQVKDLTQKILDNAAASTKRKHESEKSAKEDSHPRSVLADQPKGEAGVKRPREADSNLQPGTKRMAVTNPLKDVNKHAPASNGPVKGAQSSKPTGAAVLRPKANIVAPKPTSLFGTLSSASKRPGTTNADRAAAAAAAKPTAASEKEKTPAPKPSFSFGDIMADLNKPKQAPSPKPAEDQPPETEAERKNRLRKEERRKLRVTWKPDDALTEVRLFTHDPDEELGPGDGSLRSRGDVKGEGSVLKLHKDMDELEEEDLGETVFQDGYTLSMVDFDFEESNDGSFIKRGGTQLPTSPEREAQEHRESTTLMVFYTSPADMPDTPKEPPAPDPDDIVTDVLPFGELPDLVKVRQERYYSYMNPKPTTPQPTQQPQRPTPGDSGFDISNLLKIIQGVPGQAQPIPAPQATQPGGMPDLERTISMFRQQQPQPQVPPAPPVPIPQPQGLDFNAILNVMKQMQAPPAYSQPQQSQSAMAPNLGAMFAQFGGQNQNGALPFRQQGHDYEDPERKRGREGGYYDDNSNPESWSRSKRTKFGANEAKPYKVGLVACRFWAEGKCRKGDNCTFRHDPL